MKVRVSAVDPSNSNISLRHNTFRPSSKIAKLFSVPVQGEVWNVRTREKREISPVIN